MNLILFEADEASIRHADAGPATATVITLPRHDPRAIHIVNVLRAGPGKAIRIGTIDGPLGTAAIRQVDEGAVTLECEFEGHPPPRPRIDLLLALPRPKVLRRLWAQLAALGVGRIMLTNAERVERNYFDTHVLTAGCYRPLLIEGLQQARDTHLPAVTIHRQFRVLVEDQLDHLVGGSTRIVADPQATRSPGEAVAQGAGGRIVLAVGPEGGWNAFELALLAAHGFQCVGMGPRTLRTDTACVALIAIVNRES